MAVPQTIAAAWKPAIAPTDFSIVNQPSASSYPIGGYSWALLDTRQTSQAAPAARRHRPRPRHRPRRDTAHRINKRQPMPSPVTFPARRRLTWYVLLDMPVRLTPPRDTAEGTARSLVLGHRELGDDGTEPGWLVMLDVSNTGWSPVHSTDFTTPLTFAFPGRQVLAVWLFPKPVSRRTPRPAPEPPVRLPAGSSGQRGGTGEPDRVEFAGPFLLRPADGYGITVILTGTPAAYFQRPIQLEGTLPGGSVTTRPGP